MSQENVEIVRHCFELFRRADYGATLAYFDPSVETVEPEEMPGAATYVGYEGLAEAFSHFADAWEGYTVEAEQLTAAGENQVVASAKYHAIGKESGVPVETSVSHVYEFAAGRIVRWRMFNSRAEALEAVGLSE
jgi:ketosteroid isomerase-like protein